MTSPKKDMHKALLFALLASAQHLACASDDDEDGNDEDLFERQWDVEYLWVATLVPLALTVVACIFAAIFRIALPRIYEPRVWKAMPGIESASKPLSSNPILALWEIARRPLSQVSDVVGLDAMSFLSSGRALLYCVVLYIIIGAPLMLPAYCWDDYWANAPGFEAENLPILGVCSIINVPPDHNRLWVTVIATYLFTIILIVAILWNLCYVQHMKREYQKQRRPYRYYSVLVSAIPEGERSAAQVQRFFEENGYGVEAACPIKSLGSEYYNQVRRYKKAFRELHRWQHKEKRALARGKDTPLQMRLAWPNWCEKVNAVAYYQSKCDECRAELEQYRNGYETLEDQGVSIVTFKTLSDASKAHSEFRLGDLGDPGLHYRVDPAPEPRDLFWWSMENSMSGAFFRLGSLMWLWWSTAFVIFVFAFAVAGLQALRVWNYEHEDEQSSTGGLILGFLPSLGLVILNWLASYVLYLLALFAGLPSRRLVQDAWMWQYFSYLIIDAFLVTFFSGALLGGGYDSDIPWYDFLGIALPASAAFFFVFIATQAFTALVPRVALPHNLFKAIWRCAWHSTGWELDYSTAPGKPKFAKMYGRDAFIFAITFCFGICAPGVLIMGFVYFILSHLVFKYKFLYNYRSAFQSEGMLAIPAARQVLTGTAVAQICLGIVIATKTFWMCFLIIPILLLTILLIILLPFIYRRLHDHGLGSELAAEFDADTSEVQRNSKKASLFAASQCHWMQPSLKVDIDQPLPGRFFWQDCPREQRYSHDPVEMRELIAAELSLGDHESLDDFTSDEEPLSAAAE
mmetsp:Transcript_25733/g.60057  ORF Transcript_25733/g.60057 Transcript_25733/m.60057 type:complete len:801 (-) Transcript_25733:29-2431(-)